MPLIDDASFTAMVEAWAPHLYRTAAWLGADRATAEDLVQETLLRAWNARSSLRDGASARAWLVTILRRESARRFERLQPPPGTVDPDDLAFGDPACPTVEVLAVRAAVAALEPMYREPLVLQVVWGMSCAEIAEAMEITPAAVTTRLFRAREQVRDRLDGRPAGRIAASAS